MHTSKQNFSLYLVQQPVHDKTPNIAGYIVLSGNIATFVHFLMNYLLGADYVASDKWQKWEFLHCFSVISSDTTPFEERTLMAHLAEVSY